MSAAFLRSLELSLAASRQTGIVLLSLGLPCRLNGFERTENHDSCKAGKLALDNYLYIRHNPNNSLHQRAMYEGKVVSLLQD